MNTKTEREQMSVFTRRTFLRGLGTCVALPALASLRPLQALAKVAPASIATTETGAPLRTAFLYFPNGAIQPTWWPKGEGTDFTLHSTLEPLQDLKQHIQVLGGLDHQHATAGPDGAGDHARASGTFLTGVRMKKSATDIRAGVSIDQVIARDIGRLTRFSSLELTCDAVRKTGACDSGYACAYQFNLAWSSPTTPLTPEGNPRLLFERLFGAGSPGERAASLQRRQQEQRSLLDFVLEDARDMKRRLDASDRAKLDQYLTGIREIETRIQKSEQFGKTPDPAIETPAGVPTEYAEYMELMFDMLVLAFQTDSTRVATFLLAHDGSNRPFPQIGVTEGHHELSHHQNRQDWMDKVAAIDKWYVSRFAKFLQKLQDTKDVDGKSLLHNSMIVYGAGNSDGNRHTHHNLPIVLAGHAGGAFTTGRYVKHGGKPMSNLYLTVADRLGVQGLETFGDATGRLANV